MLFRLPANTVSWTSGHVLISEGSGAVWGSVIAASVSLRMSLARCKRGALARIFFRFPCCTVCSANCSPQYALHLKLHYCPEVLHNRIMSAGRRGKAGLCLMLLQGAAEIKIGENVRPRRRTHQTQRLKLTLGQSRARCKLLS